MSKFPQIVDALLAATPGPFSLGVGINPGDGTPVATFALGAGVAPAPRRQVKDARKRAKRGLAKLKMAVS